THVDGVTVAGLTLEEVIDKLAGPPNSAVSLTIERKNREAFDVTFVRQVIYVHNIKSQVKDDVGYIKIKAFNEQTHTNLVKVLEGLKKGMGQRLRGYVVDLRDDPGGLLDQVIAVADDFLDHGAIVLQRTRDGYQQAHAHPGDITDGMPIVVLINNGTAAGAE